MLSYAFQVLRENGYKNVSTEEFENASDLCAAILVNGISQQIKQGLHREYITKTESLPTIKGQVNFTASSIMAFRTSKNIECSFDEFSVDTVMNRILKETMRMLLSADIKPERKESLRKLLLYFSEISPIDLHSVNWNLQFNRNNRTYQMLIAICHLVFKGLLQTRSDGSTYLMDFFDEQRMSHLYEKFLLEYFRHHWGSNINVGSPVIAWQLDNDNTYQLPKMQSDIVLSKGNDYLIIDAKYYGENMQENMGSQTIKSAHLYQIFAYVKNKEFELQKNNVEHTVSGLLLYAMSNSDIQPDAHYSMSGNSISASTLNLDSEWDEISSSLNAIVEQYFLIPE